MRSATGAIKVVDDKAQAALGQLQAAHKAIDALEVCGHVLTNVWSCVYVCVCVCIVGWCCRMGGGAFLSSHPDSPSTSPRQEKQAAWRRETLELLKEVEGCV